MSKPKFYLGIRNEVASSTLELFFTDFIQDSWDWYSGETNMVQDTINKIKDANPTTIKVLINSLGGDVQIGLALYNFLKSHPAEVITDNISFSASIATIMQMAASTGKRRMAKNAFMIIHAAWGLAIGNADEMKVQAEILQKVTDQLAEIYATASGKHDAKYFKSLWKDGDYWMTGDEALELGLVDELYNTETVLAKVDLEPYGFKNTPPNLFAAAEKPDNTNFLTSIKADFMKVLDSLKAALGKGKDDKDSDKISNKAEILALVEKILTPFAEAVDKALEETKPAEEVKPAEKTAEELKAEADKKAQDEAAAKEKETKDVDPVAKLQADLKAQTEKFDKLLATLAAQGSKPGGNAGGDAPKTIGTAEYEAD